MSLREDYVNSAKYYISQNPNIQFTLLPFYIGSNLFYFKLDMIKLDPASPNP